MTENNLFQLAQVVSDLSPMEQRSRRRTLPLRKNACAVCAICFTCSKNYASNCTCDELQPRRGKNLPENGLDSRAKKLNKNDRQDYDFTIHWLQDHAHAIYRDERNQIIGLDQQTEVGLCKAHSSTLYRAKKRWERERRSSSPMEGIDQPPSSSSSSSSMSGLAAKVKELQYHQQQQQQQATIKMEPDFAMTPSTSYKRKRTEVPPHASASTPLYATGPLMKTSQHSMSSPPMSYQLPPLQQQQPHTPSSSPASASSPPPPPHQQPSPVASSLSSLSSSLQHQLYLSTKYRPNMLRHPSPQQQQQQQQQGQQGQQGQAQQHHPPPPPQHHHHHHPSSLHHHHQHHHSHHASSTPPPSNVPGGAPPTLPSPTHPQQPSPTSPLPSLMLPSHPSIQVETVSLKSLPSDEPAIYFIRNLAITDTFTFRHLLDETDITSAPPPGKRIIITDTMNERIFPLSQAIRSVLPRPPSSHMEFCLALTDKTPIDWNVCT
ncbi:hypothetical protein BC940DRAFT_348867 [Gongronella butleri]|nr:hypothetical protein BC940DRAFT_348867 [Gongronella butleri]